MFWWLGRPEGSLRDYLPPICAANCSLRSLLLAPPQVAAVRENWRILEGLPFHNYEARDRHLNWGFLALKSTSPLTDWISSPRSAIKTTAHPEVDVPLVKILTLCCNHKHPLFPEERQEAQYKMIHITQQHQD